MVPFLFTSTAMMRPIHEKKMRHQSRSPLRELRFVAVAGRCYVRVKAAAMLIGLRQHVLGASEEACEARWETVHESIGNDLGQLCKSLGGFHVKVGQFFSLRPDLVPEQWCRQLSILCDAVEALPAEQARRLAESSLPQVTFSEWVDAPLGSASVAQVHAARLAPDDAGLQNGRRNGRRSCRGKPVAVKVRRPETRYFARDLAAVRMAARLLQRFELDFDLLSAVDELRDRVAIELDFRNEYHHLVTSGAALARFTGGAVAAPAAIAASDGCLITELLEGYSTLASLARAADAREGGTGGGSGGDGRESGGHDGAGDATIGLVHRGLLRDQRRSLLGRRMVQDVYRAYGQMLLLSPVFHADPHPGNIMLPMAGGGHGHGITAASRVAAGGGLRVLRALTPPGLRRLLPLAKPRVYIVDWGQCGGPTNSTRRRALAKLYLALAANQEADSVAGLEPATPGERRVASALRELGVTKPGETDDGVEARMARGLFDSGGDFVVQTRAQQRKAAASGVPQGGVEVMPKDLFLVIRVTQMLRGLGAAAEMAGAGSAGSLAHVWGPYARRAHRART